jgi:hypothetical protein
MKILMALGFISASSMQGVYATAAQESETNFDKIAYSIEASTTLAKEDKLSLNIRLERFEELSDQERVIFFQELEESNISIPEARASQPTFISNSR